MELTKINLGLKSLIPNLLPSVRDLLPNWVKSSYQASRGSEPKLKLLEKSSAQSDASTALHPELREIFGTASDPKAQAVEQAKSSFIEKFGAKAQDKREFHDFMRQVFGAGYDQAKAEEFRQKALKGDYSWLPNIEFLDDKTLQGGHGAYDAEKGVVYINEKLLSNPELMAQTYLEEAGHHLDTQLNTTDAVGDEGEMFRRVLSGEKLSEAQIREIRNDNDQGQIRVNGKLVNVEFWKPFEAIGNAFRKIGQGIKNFFTKAFEGAKSFFTGVAKGIGTAVSGMARGVGGFFKNLFQGKVGDAFGSLGQGFKSLFYEGPAKIINGVFNSIESTVDGVTGLLGPLAPVARQVSSRLLDAGRTLATGTVGLVGGVAQNLAEGAGTFFGGFGKVFKGDFKGGFKDMGLGLLKVAVQTPTDAVVFAGGKYLGAVQTLTGLEPVGSRLTGEEIAELRKIYGDSIDYEQVRIKRGVAGIFSANSRPFTFGNTIYLKDDKSFETLVHEMGHVWQFQNGGTDYISEAVTSQWFGKGYEFNKSVPGTPWSQLEPEQQSALIEAAYQGGYFNPASKNYGKFLYDTNGDGVAEDLTAYFQDALGQIRAGKGTP